MILGRIDQSVLGKVTEERFYVHEVYVDLLNAETGQRGFLLTGSDQYAAPYVQGQAKFHSDFDSLKKVLGDNPVNKSFISRFDSLSNDKLTELAETVATRKQENGFQEAVAIVETNKGNDLMTKIRDLIITKLGDCNSTIQTFHNQLGVLSWIIIVGGSFSILLELTLILNFFFVRRT